MVRACPNQNVTLAYLVCVHVAVREPIHRDLLSPSTLWVLRLSICPAICTLACPSICLSAGLFCVPSVCPSLCPIVHSHASHGRPPVLWILCLPPCAFHLLVPLSVASPCLSLSIPYILHLCIRSCVPVCLEHPSCLRLLIIFHSNLPKHFSRPDRLRCPMPALQRGRSAYSYWLNCPSLKQFLPPPSSLCLHGVIYIVN